MKNYMKKEQSEVCEARAPTISKKSRKRRQSHHSLPLAATSLGILLSTATTMFLLTVVLHHTRGPKALSVEAFTYSVTRRSVLRTTPSAGDSPSRRRRGDLMLPQLESSSLLFLRRGYRRNRVGFTAGSLNAAASKAVAPQRKTAASPPSTPTTPGGAVSAVGNTIHVHLPTPLLMATNSRELRFYNNEPPLLARTDGDALPGRLEVQTTPAINNGQNSYEELSTHHKNGFGTNNNGDVNNGSDGLFGSTSTKCGSSQGNGSGEVVQIPLTLEEQQLFDLLREVTKETKIGTTLRVAGGWVRDKLLATPEFQRNRYYYTFDASDDDGESGTIQRLTSKFLQKKKGFLQQQQQDKRKQQQPSMGRQGTKVMTASGGKEEYSQPVDIDIALDDMLGREFADHLNHYLSSKGQERVSVGVVLKNPEKSKHLETATMKVGSFWIDFVNLRAEEYTQDSRIPDLMRIGTAAEDAFRRDLTINALFYNINSQQVEDWTGRGLDDLRRGVVSTPLSPLTTLLDDPLRVLRSVRFAARLHFTMDDALMNAAKQSKVRTALAQKVARERVGGEVDLMLRSPDPVGAMRLLFNLNLTDTVFPLNQVVPFKLATVDGGESSSGPAASSELFQNGLQLLSVTHEHMCDSKVTPPIWCESSVTTHGYVEHKLMEDEESRRLLWYSALLKPLHDLSNQWQETRASPSKSRKANRSVVWRLLVDHLKRPTRDADRIEVILKGADNITELLNTGFDRSAMTILMKDIQVMAAPQQKVLSCDEDEGDSLQEEQGDPNRLVCTMNDRTINSETETDPIWKEAMEFRFLSSRMLERCDHLWRAALMLSLSEDLKRWSQDQYSETEYAIEGDVLEDLQAEGRRGIIQRYDVFATALQRLGLIGIWARPPLLDGKAMKKILTRIPRGPAFREVMDEQSKWMTTHPDGRVESLTRHLQEMFADYV